METNIINCKEIANQIRKNLAEKIQSIKMKRKIEPGLATIIVGGDPASKAYVQNKEKVCIQVGLKSYTFELEEKTSEEKLINLIDELNNREDIHGILVQLPLPKHIDENRIAKLISPEKDVDGFNPENSGRLFRGEKCLVPCTAKAILKILKSSNIEIQGKKAAVIGRSNIVGKPTAMLLLNNNATVTICHSKTQNLKGSINDCDIVVCAVGHPGLVKGDMIKEGSVIIDAGTRVVDGKLKGDLDFDTALGVASYITPVPGGVGALTTTMLIENVLEAYESNE